MAGLILSGVGTGIDTASIINQLMILNSRRLALYQLKQQKLESQQGVLDELESVVNSLKTASSSLADADNLEIFRTSSSDTDILTVSASADANPGSHSVEIDQLASNETWLQSNSDFSYKTDYVGEGTFIFSYNNQECVITTAENETTLEDLVNLINDDQDNAGVTAGLLYQGGKYHLMLSGQESGGDYQITVNAESTEVWASSTDGGSFTEDGNYATLSTKITGLGEFSGTLGTSDNAKITISGKNHFGTSLSPDFELDITANTTVGHLVDAINEHFDGVATARFEKGEIYLTDNICDNSGLEIGLSYSQGSGSTSLTLPTMAVSAEGGATTADLFIDDFIEIQSAADSRIRIDGYPSSSMAEAEEQALSLDSVATGGTFRLTYNGQTTAAINYNATTAEIQTALEGLSTVSSGDITVGGTSLDQASDTTFTFLASAGNVGLISIDATSLTGPTTLSVSETTQGSDGWMHRNSNNIADAMTGITLNLKSTTEAGSPIEVSISRDTSALRSKVLILVNAYNGIVSFMDTNTEYNVDTKEMGMLSNNLAVKYIESNVRNELIGIIDGFTDSIDSFTQISDIGLTINGEGKLELDTSDFDAAVDENYKDVLELLGAMKTGNSSSNVVRFYQASDTYTEGGVYDVQVTVEDVEGSNVITAAKIKLASESTWHDATWSGNLVTGNSEFDDDGGGPLYAENSLQTTVDLTSTGTFDATVRVKQGFAGALEDLLKDTLASDGTIDNSKDVLGIRIETMESTVEREQDRLETINERLIARFARMEKTLMLMQRQSATVSALFSQIMSQ